MLSAVCRRLNAAFPALILHSIFSAQDLGPLPMVPSLQLRKLERCTRNVLRDSDLTRDAVRQLYHDSFRALHQPAQDCVSGTSWHCNTHSADGSTILCNRRLLCEQALMPQSMLLKCALASSFSREG